MRSIYLILFTLLALACSRSSEKNHEKSSGSNSFNDTEAVTKEPRSEKKEPAGVRLPDLSAWEGLMNDRIPFSFWLEQKGDVISGELKYKSTGIPIRVIGEWNSYGSYYLREYDKKGNITGVFTIIYDGKSLSGDWFSPQSDKEFKIVASEKGETGSGILNDKMIAYDGVYRYSYGEEGPNGYLEVSHLDGDSINIEFSNTTRAPAYNMADMEAHVELNGNKAVYKMHDGDYVDCEFEMIFYKDFVFVQYLNDKFECGFGHNAHVSGIYFKLEGENKMKE
jgi:hypothetical protein